MLANVNHPTEESETVKKKEHVRVRFMYVDSVQVAKVSVENSPRRDGALLFKVWTLVNEHLITAGCSKIPLEHFDQIARESGYTMYEFALRRNKVPKTFRDNAEFTINLVAHPKRIIY
ncbi:MAG TPA: hypothetical protein VN420_02230 [Candidatus Fimivivens sp.]|nr:hypothetical protein [Candidatus Fimivivens sp.]